MTVSKFQEQLAVAFPETVREPLVQGITDGIALADNLIEATPLLSSVIGRDIRGFLRRAGILHQVGGLCAKGVIPFAAQQAKMPVGCWHWLNISSGFITAHIVRTESLRALPGDTPSRQPEVLKNEFDLFEDGRIPPPPPENQNEERYAVITFGLDKDGKVTHAAAGMPNFELTGWLAFINLRKRASLSESFKAPVAPVPPDPTTRLKFLKEVQQMLDERERGEDEKTG